MKWKQPFHVPMKKLFRLEGFTLTELLVTMTLFALVMSVVTTIVSMQLRMIQRFSRGRNNQALFWHHIETISLQTIQWTTTDAGWQWKTYDGRIYEVRKEPLSLREITSGMVWKYPFQADVSITAHTNGGRVVLQATLRGVSFDESRILALGWEKGENP
ncbi:MAG: type II secretion system protein J [Brevinematales bacterium]